MTKSDGRYEGYNAEVSGSSSPVRSMWLAEVLTDVLADAEPEVPTEKFASDESVKNESSEGEFNGDVVADREDPEVCDDPMDVRTEGCLGSEEGKIAAP